MSKEVKKETMVRDDEGIAVIPFIVSENLATVLDSQRAKLDQVDATKTGKERYRLAREAGCFAAVSKGAKDRELKENQLFIPGTEMSVTNGILRISALKASLPMDPNWKARNVTFRRVRGLVTGNDGAAVEDIWQGDVEINPPLDSAEAA
jgi:hypothetical protein